jgi:sugar/nucleoside kinase (ribokinase family)
VCACGKVGADEYGAWLRAFLDGKGLDVSRVRQTEAAPTSYTDVMSVEGTGERTFFHARGANALFTPDDIDLDALDCDLFHLGYLLLLDGLDASDAEYGTVAARLLHDVQARGILTSVDIVSEQSNRFARIVRPALKYCDHLVVNEIEASRLAGVEGDLREIAARLFELGVQRRVVIHMPEKGVSLLRDGTWTEVGSVALPAGFIKGKTGAGDAYCAGVLTGIYRGAADEDILELGALAAIGALTHVGAVEGVKPEKELRELVARFNNTSC